MINLRIAICDDVKPMLDFLRREIDERFLERDIEHSIEIYTNGEDFLSEHKQNPFDIVFLDIVMPETDGFKVAKEIRAIKSKTYIIFVTTESAMVFDSLDFQPFHFIPKGSFEVIKDRLDHVLKKLIIHFSSNSRIELNMPYGETRCVEPTEIYYVKSSKNYVDFFLGDDENDSALRVRGKIDDVVKKLSPYLFAAIHKRYIVNMQHIKKVDFPNSRIILKNGECLGISRACKGEFEKAYNRYLRSFE